MYFLVILCLYICKAGNSNEKMFPLSGKVFSHSESSGKNLSKIFLDKKIFKKISLKRLKLLFTQVMIIKIFYFIFLVEV